jgi:hypothetical protein
MYWNHSYCILLSFRFMTSNLDLLVVLPNHFSQNYLLPPQIYLQAMYDLHAHVFLFKGSYSIRFKIWNNSFFEFGFCSKNDIFSLTNHLRYLAIYLCIGIDNIKGPT